MRRINFDKFSFVLFILSLLFFSFCYGFVSGHFKIFPFKIISTLYAKTIPSFFKRTGMVDPWYYAHTDRDFAERIYCNENKAYMGVNLITSVQANNNLAVKIMDMQGKVIHKWSIDWFKIWPDAKHIYEKEQPKAKPGTHVHGAVVLANGDLIFNFEHLGLVRLDKRGEVIWRLPYRTHHSIHVSEDGNLWVCGQINHKKAISKVPNYKPEFIEPTILEVTVDGDIIHEISVFDLLIENGYEGLLSMSTINNKSTIVTGDTLHLNDVEPFPQSMDEGFFKHGDVMISLRNINTIIVFRLKSKKIKCILTGRFVRQHDPDFIDGNIISVFDNNNVSLAKNKQSRIVFLKAPENTISGYLEGGNDFPFFTSIMGKHQWLPNGNLLITESMNGRAFEIDKNKLIVWEYFNFVSEHKVGLMEEVQRLPKKYESVYGYNDQ
jgi:hypothetical protein